MHHQSGWLPALLGSLPNLMDLPYFKSMAHTLTTKVDVKKTRFHHLR